MRMLARFIPPTSAEGFDEIKYISPEPYAHKNKVVFLSKLEQFLS
jgi:hypothetical protein